MTEIEAYIEDLLERASHEDPEPTIVTGHSAGWPDNQDVSGRAEPVTPVLAEHREALDAVLKGWGIALFSDRLGERYWLVADEEDGALLMRQGEARGSMYTAEEVQAIAVIEDPEIACEVHRIKRLFDRGRLRLERTEGGT